MSSPLYYLGGSSAKVGFLPGFVYWYSSHLPCITWGFISQRRFICQVLCTGIQVISPVLPERSISQSMFICQVLFTGIQVISPLLPRGVHWSKYVHLPKFCVLVFKSSLSSTTQGAICQIMFICKVLCTGIQGIYALFGGSICQSRFICQVLCTGIQVICPLLPRGVHWPK